jgi:hypothetical protein
MKADAARLKEYPDAGCFQFMTDARAKFGAAGTVVMNAIGTARLAEFDALLARLGNLVGWPGMKVINAELKASDRELDHSLSAFAAYLRNIIRYGKDSALKAAANRVLEMLKRFGKIATKSYETQEGDLTAVLDNLNGEFAADVTALGMAGLQADLQAAFDNFKALLAQHDAIDKARPRDPDGKPDRAPKVRRLLQKLYRDIASLINAGAKLGTSPEFAALIAELNPIIDRYNRQYQPVLYDISKSQPAPIPDQPWTGEEVTPLPSSVLFKKGGRQLKLRLGRHYDVSYKNNIDVGNAYCILHGKGRYKGSKSVSFIIRHGVSAAEWEDEIKEAEAAKAEEAKKKAVKTKKAAKANEQLAMSNEQLKDVKRKPLAKADEAPKGDKEKATKAAKKAEAEE